LNYRLKKIVFSTWGKVHSWKNFFLLHEIELVMALRGKSIFSSLPRIYPGSLINLLIERNLFHAIFPMNIGIDLVGKNWLGLTFNSVLSQKSRLDKRRNSVNAEEQRNAHAY
jgi:hypothetical protein